MSVFRCFSINLGGNSNLKDETSRKNIKISVIIPVYNVEKYLQNCIDSLINQSFEDIEFIFVNDASPDNSLSILYENQKKYPDKIVVIDSKKNLRQGGARNLGIKAARGEYIGFVDSDDLVLKDMYRRMYDVIKNAELDVVFCQHSRIAEDFKDYNISNKELKAEVVFNDYLISLNDKKLNDQDITNLIIEPLGGVWAGLWRKSLLIENNIYFPENLRYEDNYWSALIKSQLKKLFFINDIFYLYRSNPISTVNARNQKYNYDRIKIEKMLLEEVKKRNLFEKYKVAWEYIFITRYVVNTVLIFIKKFDVIDSRTILNIVCDLEQEFPDWYNNPIFKTRLSFKEKLRVKKIVNYTRFYLMYKMMYKKLKITRR